ncbi:MAG: DUF951 domain-containing protein [Caldilineales bacterium]|nr:DUF951 domain-containing protein [Caldilineales bacterium]MCW5860596.1 DUF951 domain-containing protein [Caldilineales bacterium]
MTYLPIHIGDIVRLRKPHPCGGYEWAVVRTGADIGLVCQTCKRRLLLPRDEFRKAVKTFVHHAPEPAPDLATQIDNT